jgi:hypothetical protein
VVIFGLDLRWNGKCLASNHPLILLIKQMLKSKQRRYRGLWLEDRRPPEKTVDLDANSLYIHESHPPWADRAE